MWVFLATEAMFFTGLLASYLVLRSASPPDAYSNLFPPGTDLSERRKWVGLKTEWLAKETSALDQVAPYFLPYRADAGADMGDYMTHSGWLQVPGLRPSAAAELVEKLMADGVPVEMIPLRTASWPHPFDSAMNPLSPLLTGLATCLLIASAVTIRRASDAIKRGDRRVGSRGLFWTCFLGAAFLGFQVYEYWRLSLTRAWPIGVSASGYFRPDSSVFASNFYLLTGCHALHVAAGLLVLAWLWLRSLRGAYDGGRSQAVELGGLYWHFVDVVWVVLFASVYLI
jgi:cytochrome c oxidase subunit 3